MSMTKRILFGRNPADDPVRERMRRDTADYLESFTHRIPMKRRAKHGPRYWDSLWPYSLERARLELEIEVVRINGGMFTREAAERDAVLSRPEAIWRDVGKGDSA